MILNQGRFAAGEEDTDLVGGFGDGEGWTYDGAFWTLSNDVAVLTDSGSTRRNLVKGIANQAGVDYLIEITVSAISKGTLEVAMSTTGAVDITDITAPGTYNVVAVSSESAGTITVRNRVNRDTTATVTSLTVRPV